MYSLSNPAYLLLFQGNKVLTPYRESTRAGWRSLAFLYFHVEVNDTWNFETHLPVSEGVRDAAGTELYTWGQQGL